MSNEFSKAIWGTSNEEEFLLDIKIKNPPDTGICDCGKKATKVHTFYREIVSYLCDDCAEKKQKKLDEYDNDPETIAFRKTWRIACKMALGNYDPFVEKE